MSGPDWKDLDPEARAEIERAVAHTSEDVAAMTASTAKPWRAMSRVSYMDTPIAACAHFPSRPGQLGRAKWEAERAAINRRDNLFIAACLAVLAAPGVVALVRWLW